MIVWYYCSLINLYLTHSTKTVGNHVTTDTSVTTP